MEIAMVTGRLKALRRTKLYDLLAAAPLIAWYGFCAAQVLPSLGQRVALLNLFGRIDPSMLPATLVLSTVSEVITLAFFVLLVVMFTPSRSCWLSPALFSRFLRCLFSGVRSACCPRPGAS